ncbi:uncharacterized protein LOC130988711 [Salvia miltiorrhiza]|uniref:uncharacterized protein LOC130988711 n=1 Tax=Salvia miltiorrhiza TaxID=226208 RepID=UPI0025AC91CB|nr:uncharacterized protein LOC130988711 [Salvia miltiorrhiza]XP_057768617.1 uncharacterized protein LOC130988711 [Salvia miltiorrhiza]XP_057768618.1 uncharacterized protein LOC130988711 [Salvia miltiorrhiza]XP_057768619.1 uncharacterized protein LOC130988711 [Salvia miltiorrhiza]XP_057768620.1 uncharacterized protein LOC130988711 [Salvia miltiorrhiza]XP_057768621.1 uncharacterized protein LOC130988711 [Salvia miltiorrhiza]
MLQRQIMFKQLQEMQRKQQLQELSNTRNQNYVNQLSSLKHASGGQFSPTVNGTPMQDLSGMFMVGNMMQHGGPNGLVLAQSPVGLSQPQLDISLYGNHTPNPDKNLNPYSHLHGPSNLSTDQLTKNNSSPLGMVTMQPSAFSNSFMSQHCNFPSEQINMTDGSVHSNQEKDLFGQAPTEGLHGAVLPGNYSEQGIRMQGNASALEFEGRHEDAGWGRIPPGKTSNFGMSVVGDSLDPLEQKILYNTDDDSWGSFSRSCKMSTGGFGGTLESMSDMDGLPSLQSGSWSALMQSALEETSGNDPGVQEEWSGLSFQNPEPSNDNQHPKSNDSKRVQNNWVNRNSPNAVSPSSKPQQLAQNFNMNSGFANFQQSGYQYQKQKEEYHPESSHATTQNSPRNMSLLADYNSQQKRPSGRTPVSQTSLSLPNIWPGQHKENPNNDAHEPSLLSCTNDNQPRNDFSGQEFKGAFWLQGSTSQHVPGVIQKPYDQMNQINSHGYSVDPENMTSGVNVEAVSSVLNASLERPGENMTAPSESMIELLNKDDTSNDEASVMQLNLKVSTPREFGLSDTSGATFAKPCRLSDPQTLQPHSVFPSLSMVASSATSLSSHIVNDHVENQHPASPVPSHMNAEVPLSDNVVVAQPSLTSDRLQHVGFQMGQHTQWQGMPSQQDTSGPKPYKYSSSLFGSPDSASSSIRTSSAAPNEQHYQNYSQQVYNAKQYSENVAGLDQRLEKGSSIHEGSTDINSSTSLSSNIQKQELLREHGSEAGAIVSGSLITDDGKSFPPKPDSVNYQHPSVNLEELFLSGQDSGKEGVAKTDLNALSCLDAYSSGDSKGWKLSQGGQGDQSGKALLTSYHQNFQQSMLSQNDILTRSVGSNRASNVVYPSQISLPMVQSWFKQYETLKNGQRLPIHDSRAAIHATQLSSEMTPGNLQDNSLNMQVKLANPSQGSGLLAPTSTNPVLYKQLNTPSILPSDASHQNLAVTLRKKRKLVAFTMVPWHKEVNHDQWGPQNISMAELSWAQAANRREEEVISEAESVEELHPVIQAKRRLICCTQLMQQVFQPAPSVIICMDSSSNCDYIAYYAARLALGDACSLTGQLPPDSMDVSCSHDKQKTSRRTDACKFSKVMEGIVCRVKKLEDDLTRLDKSLSIVDIKVEAQELEKFSTINRFAKFHIRAQPSSVDPATSSGTPTLHKTHPQRYVVGHPMPKILPEGIDCLSL